MADPRYSDRSDSSGPQSPPSSTNSVKQLASPRKQGRFLIIEPPRMEEEDDLSDSSSSAVVSPRFGVSRGIESRFGMATRTVAASDQNNAIGSTASVQTSGSGKTGAPLSSASSDTIGSSKQVQSPPSSLTTTVAPFVVKNTDGPLFDPAMAAAFGWDEEGESSSAGDDKPVLARAKSSKSSKSAKTINVISTDNLLPPMSEHGSGQLSRKERERVRLEWLNNIVAHKKELERAAALEREQALSEMVEKKRLRALQLQQQSAAKAATEAANAATEAANAQTSLPPSQSPERSPSQAAVQLLDLATYQATKRFSSEIVQQGSVSPSSLSTPASLLPRQSGHRRSLSDLSIEAKMQARRDSGPPPPRPIDASSSSTADSEDLTLDLKKAREKEHASPKKSHKSKRSPNRKQIAEIPVVEQDPPTSGLNASFSDTDIASSSTDSLHRSPPKKAKQLVVVQDPPPAATPSSSALTDKTRGRSASVSKKIGVFIGRIFETKPKQEKDRIGSSKSSKSKPSLSVSSGSISRSDTLTPGHAAAPHFGLNSSGGDDISPDVSASPNSNSSSLASAPTASLPIRSPVSHAYPENSEVNISSSAPHATLATERMDETSSSSPPTLHHNMSAAHPPTMVSSTSSESVHGIVAPMHVDNSANKKAPSSSSTTKTDSGRVPNNSLNDASSDTPSRPSRPKPPVPPKPKSFRHANTMRPSTSTKKEFGLEDD